MVHSLLVAMFVIASYVVCMRVPNGIRYVVQRTYRLSVHEKSLPKSGAFAFNKRTNIAASFISVSLFLFKSEFTQSRVTRVAISFWIIITGKQIKQNS